MTTGKQNKGEGNRTSARRYNKESEDFAQSGRVDEAAKNAKAAVESKEKEELRDAEEAGQARAKETDPAVSSEIDEFVDRLRSQLKDWELQVEKLKTQSESLSGDAKTAINEQLEKMRAHRDDTTRKMKDLQDSSGEAWAEIRSGLESSWETMQDAFKRAREHFDSSESTDDRPDKTSRQ